MLSDRRRRRGYAMALMLLVLVLLSTITATMVSTAYSNQESSTFVAARAEAKLLAVSSLEELFARLNDGESTADILATHPAIAPGWARLPMSSQRLPDDVDDVALGAEPCPEGDDAFTVDCYQVRIDDSAKALVTVDVTLRTRCAGLESRCVLTSFQQTLRRVQFFDFAVSYEYTTLAPEALFPAGSYEAGRVNAASYSSYKAACTAYASARDLVTSSWSLVSGTSAYASGGFTPSTQPASTVTGCVDVSYQADAGRGDSLAGRVYTTDDYVTVCGNPLFDQMLVSGGGSSGRAWRPVDIAGTNPCAGSAPRFTGRYRQSEIVGAPMLNLPDIDAILEAAVAAPTRLRVGKSSADTPVTVTFTPAGVTVRNSTGDVTSFGYDGLTIVIDGDGRPGSTDVLMSGTVRGAVSVVVDGSVAITGDLVYESGGVVTNTRDVLSLTAADRIEIWQQCQVSAAASAACLSASVPVRKVHGILTVPEGFVGVPDWQTSTAPAPQVLEFFGAIASLHQGVFGAYSEVDGRLVSGFTKAFTFDNRPTRKTNGREDALSALPPFFVTSTSPVWERLDVIETAYEGSSLPQAPSDSRPTQRVG